MTFSLFLLPSRSFSVKLQKKKTPPFALLRIWPLAETLYFYSRQLNVPSNQVTTAIKCIHFIIVIKKNKYYITEYFRCRRTARQNDSYLTYNDVLKGWIFFLYRIENTETKRVWNYDRGGQIGRLIVVLHLPILTLKFMLYTSMTLSDLSASSTSYRRRRKNGFRFSWHLTRRNDETVV